MISQLRTDDNRQKQKHINLTDFLQDLCDYPKQA